MSQPPNRLSEEVPTTTLTGSPPKPSLLGAGPRSEAGRLKRVLYVLDLYPAGKFPSLAEQALLLAREFRDRGSLFLPVYVGLDSDFIDRHAKQGVAVEELDLRKFRWIALKRILRLVHENRIEVVHWNFYNPLVNGYVWALTLLAPHVAHYYTDHISRPGSEPVEGSGSKLKGLISRTLSRRYKKTFCISKYVRGELEKRHWRKLRVLYNFINTERFCPDSDQRHNAPVYERRQ